MDLEINDAVCLALALPLYALLVANASASIAFRNDASTPENRPLLINPTAAAAADLFYQDHSKWRDYRPPKKHAVRFQYNYSVFSWKLAV